MDGEALVAIERVTKRYGRRRRRDRDDDEGCAVRAVSLAVADGEAVGIVGESGSGKSTLARMIVGLERPDSGTVRIVGTPVALSGTRAGRARARQTQMIFQDPYTSLNPRMTIGAAISEPACAAGLCDAAGRDALVRGALLDVGLRPELARERPAALSGGQRQRVAIARALGVRPRVLVADEAVSALDVSLQAQILQLLRRLRSERRLTIVFISHQLGAIAQLCDRVAVMSRGCIVEVDTVRNVFERPSHPYTRQLLAAQPGRATLAPPIVTATPVAR